MAMGWALGAPTQTLLNGTTKLPQLPLTVAVIVPVPEVELLVALVVKLEPLPLSTAKRLVGETDQDTVVPVGFAIE